MENNDFEFIYNNQKYKIPIETLNEYYSSEDFDSLFFDTSKNPENLDKEVFLEGLKEYGKSKTYYFPHHAKTITIYKNFNKICSYARKNICKNISNHPQLLDSYKINKDFFNYLLQGTEKYNTTLEKVAYSYIKMCRALTYDTEFYARGQLSKLAKEHKDPAHVAQINQTNNVVTCYESNIIFGKILDYFGVCFEINNLDKQKNVYHYSITANIDGNKIYIDPLELLFSDDFFKTKTCQRVKGFKSLDKNSDKQKEIQKMIDSISLDYYEHEQDGFSNNRTYDWLDIYSGMKLLYELCDETPDKLEQICDYSQSIELPPMEKLIYLSASLNNLFEDQIKNAYFAHCIVADKKINSPVVIAAFSTIDAKLIAPSGLIFNKYCVMSTTDKPQFFDVQTLQKKFDDGEYGYIYRQTELDNHSKIVFENRLPYNIDYETPEVEKE